MGIQIEDGKGSGQNVQVSENKLRTLAVANSLSNHVSLDVTNDGGVFTVFGTATPAAGTVVPLFIQNDDPNFLLVVDRIYVQAPSVTGGTSLPNTSAYFYLGYTRTFSAGGADATPVNLNRTSAKIANITAKKTNPTLSGTAVESHRWYAQPSAIPFEMIIHRSDDIILGRANTLEIGYTSDNTGGTVYALVKFLLATIESMG